jgi:hypothetical protein
VQDRLVGCKLRYFSKSCECNYLEEIEAGYEDVDGYEEYELEGLHPRGLSRI